MPPLLPEERASLVVEAVRLSGSVDGLRSAVVSQLVEAIAEERRGLATTLNMCVIVLDQVLTLTELPGELRAAARVCRGLCREGLESPADQTESADEDIGHATKDPQTDPTQG